MNRLLDQIEETERLRDELDIARDEISYAKYQLAHERAKSSDLLKAVELHKHKNAVMMGGVEEMRGILELIRNANEHCGCGACVICKIDEMLKRLFK